MVTDAVLLSFGYKLVQSTDAMHRLKIPRRPSIINHSCQSTAISKKLTICGKYPDSGIRLYGAVPSASDFLFIIS
jgi:hypothetical protein